MVLLLRQCTLKGADIQTLHLKGVLNIFYTNTLKFYMVCKRDTIMLCLSDKYVAIKFAL